ncbi:MAG: hypothetical protein OXE59_01195 [Bacteroidetes bacterium]|nr:hypothetical protein [Bacteroidota bacterium]MCY4232351.1 hypothetical protein [Bacteroidota bacterium]
MTKKVPFKNGSLPIDILDSALSDRSRLHSDVRYSDLDLTLQEKLSVRVVLAEYLTN